MIFYDLPIFTFHVSLYKHRSTLQCYLSISDDIIHKNLYFNHTFKKPYEKYFQMVLISAYIRFVVHTYIILTPRIRDSSVTVTEKTG